MVANALFGTLITKFNGSICNHAMASSQRLDTDFKMRDFDGRFSALISHLTEFIKHNYWS